MCVGIGIFHEQIPHPGGIIFAPEFQFLFLDALIAVGFTIEIDLAGVGVLLLPDHTHDQQNGQNDHSRWNALFCLVHFSFFPSPSNLTFGCQYTT